MITPVSSGTPSLDGRVHCQAVQLFEHVPLPELDQDEA
jgi:hypothetical protein